MDNKKRQLKTSVSYRFVLFDFLRIKAFFPALFLSFLLYCFSCNRIKPVEAYTTNGKGLILYNNGKYFLYKGALWNTRYAFGYYSMDNDSIVLKSYYAPGDIKVNLSENRRGQTGKQN